MNPEDTTAQASAQRIERLETRYYGKHRGVVIANKDPLKLGRLRVWVPSLFPTEGDATPDEDSPSVSDWAWPCVPFTGADQGFFCVPEIHARIWVEYEEGNLDSPIWVGGFWSAPGGSAETPAESQELDANEPRRRVLKTSSGHVFEFSDIDGKEAVTLRHKSGALLHLDEQGSLMISNREGAFIYLNAKDTELSFADKKGNNVRLGDQSITLTNAEGTLVDLAGPAVQVVAKNVLLRTDTVQLGEGAMEPAILGRAFAAVFDAHVHPTALGPSGPPIPVPMPLSSPMHPAISKSVTVK
jgi:uncharacterized protein involved in type VI secretion and phage assembly